MSATKPGGRSKARALTVIIGLVAVAAGVSYWALGRNKSAEAGMVKARVERGTIRISRSTEVALFRGKRMPPLPPGSDNRSRLHGALTVPVSCRTPFRGSSTRSSKAPPAASAKRREDLHFARISFGYGRLFAQSSANFRPSD